MINLPKLDNKKIVLIVLMSAVLLYIDFNFIFKAQLTGLHKRNVEVASLKRNLDNFNRDLKNAKALKSKQALAFQKPRLQVKNIISESQFASLLQDISKIANNNEVSILQIKPFRELQANSQDNKAKPAGKFTPFFIILDLSSGYHNLGKFINELENLPVFLSLRDIKIEPQEDNYLKQKVNLTLRTYVKK